MRGSAAFRASVAPGGALAPAWVRDALWRNAQAVPSLDLRFADNKSLTDATTGQNLVTFTRASSGTYVGSDGVLRTAANDVPRFDHNPTTGESLGLLVEEQRTNLLLRSEEFDNASWTKINGSVTANAITAPNGTLTADKFVENTASSVAHIAANESASVTSGVVYTLSVFCKAAERSWVFMLGSGSPFGTNGVYVNLSNGAVGSSVGSPGSVAITPFGNGWHRISFALTAGSTASAGLQVRPATGDGGGTYTGDGTSGIYAWGAQLEAGAFPTSYIPTTTTALTRSADVASITGSNFSSWYRQDEGTLFAEAIPMTNTTCGLAGFDDTTAAERWRVGHSGGSAGQFLVVDGGVIQVSSTSPLNSWNLGNFGKIAGTIATNNSASSVNGQTAVEDVFCTLPAITQMTIGIAASVSCANAKIRRLTYWPQRLPNSTLQTITQ